MKIVPGYASLPACLTSITRTLIEDWRAPKRCVPRGFLRSRSCRNDRRPETMKINREETKNTNIYSSLRVLRFFAVDFRRRSEKSSAWNQKEAISDEIFCLQSSDVILAHGCDTDHSGGSVWTANHAAEDPAREIYSPERPDRHPA